MLARHVRTSPAHLQERLLQSVCADLVCGNTRTARHFVTAGRVQQYAYYHIPNPQIELVTNAPEDGPVRSETCRANICDELNQSLKKTLCILLDCIYITRRKTVPTMSSS